MRLEVVAVGVVDLARRQGSGVEDAVAVLVKDEHDAQVPRRGGAVEQDHLARARARRQGLGFAQVVDHSLERQVDDLDVAGDVPLDDL